MMQDLLKQEKISIKFLTTKYNRSVVFGVWPGGCARRAHQTSKFDE